MTAAAEPPADWRQSADMPQKVDRLVEALPSAANIMIEMGERYQNLYWAAKQGKWEFAIYQTEEIKELIEKLEITRPKRAASAREFLGVVFPLLPEATKTRDWKKFEAAFEQMRRECMACHVKNEMGFVQLPLPRRATSPVLNME
ncbi:MAG: hypothetical protein A3E57_08655 [Candidatus Muproteobacteria bacterium RIFCSPHIGHO2_12_FULL_60_33]|uniref:Cytochrome c domain-containing protein n=1 Tax=Candidatus Muproteobacteria bacterium RIFCSPLOWO2_01_FULL_60_18 TaxID=1817768 RepID=A0A1F6TWM5_9PROT|nr:MAG: hypothetical protein A3A87_04875 [Candidatus Muproteobacteria bacterium RIFCSPLOWO2_01_FULL_60_18]OGI51308.1 MAG: hypothetical protein A2W42_08385 [Candidatus Muproteobacteria bacterium RIFCSPHIGHO2_01_60_12]OGI55721.1 MAG: hypothetical protein A3D32_06220 [Candidatus Muproteobacteria bacterium RIFCSPHIGHO2_02_FULL_60_13]OGI56552.1 MAG: hypothetical protein A3E57_08655 [Candidatus Muproteobacteria bacterium RIFCSPHIGHO2_12_FULL_60_33]